MRSLSGKEITRALKRNKELVLADSREDPLVLYECGKVFKKFEIATLQSSEGSERGAGDYAFFASGKTWGIERKKINDLLTSTMTQRLEEQLAEMFLVYDGVILLIEGIYDLDINKLTTLRRYQSYRGRGWNARVCVRFGLNRFVPLQLSLQKHGVDIVGYSVQEDAAQVLGYIVRYLRSTEPAELRRWARTKPTIYTVDPNVKALLRVWDGVPQNVVEALVEKYGSAWNVLNQEPEELLSVYGLNKKRVETLWSALGRRISWQRKGRKVK
jgi:ERCC4-type nuclease